MTRLTTTAIPAARLAIHLTALAIGACGCGGPKVSGKAGAAETVEEARTLAEKLAPIEARIEALLGKFNEAAGAVDAELMAGVIEKIAGEVEAMTAAAEGHPGMTPAEFESLCKKFVKTRGNIYDVTSALYGSGVDGVSKEALDALEAAVKMFWSSFDDWRGRLAVLLDIVAPLPDSVAILPGEDDGAWFAFEDEASGLWGYRDKNGAVRIAPRFVDRTVSIDFITPKFDHITAVGEEAGNGHDSYYLTKAGKVIGKGVYKGECENEGFIRFGNPRNQKIGMLDRFGNVVIPAEYDNLSKAQNGLVAAFRYYPVEKGGNDGGDGKSGYDMFLVKVSILDTLNNVLLETDTLDGRVNPRSLSLNLYSAVKTETPHPDTATRVSFPAKGGGFYSFICYEKEFRHWLKNGLLADLTPQKLAEAMLDSVTCFTRMRDIEEYLSHTTVSWRSEKTELAGKAYDILKNDLTALLNPEREHKIFRDGHFHSQKDPKYYDNCGKERVWAYPMFWVSLSVDNEEDIFGRHNDYSFLRTDSGYKLFHASVRNNVLFLSADRGASADEFIALGNVYFRSGDYDDALALYGKALEMDSNDAIAHLNRGVARLKKGGFAKAIEGFNRAIELDSNNSRAHSNRGGAYYRVGEFAKAVADAERAIRLDSSSYNARICRALAYTAMGGYKNYKKAAADYDRAVNLAMELKKDNYLALALYNYSMLHAYMGDDYKSSGTCEIAMRLAGKDGMDYFREDIDDYNRFITIFPKNAPMRYHRGVIYARMEEYAAAAEDLKTALKLDPKHALAKWWLGNIDEKLKAAKPGAAAEAVDEAIALAEKLAPVEAKIETLIGEFKEAVGAVDVELMAGTLEKIAGEAKAMVAAAEGHPGVTLAEIDSLDEKVAKVRESVKGIMDNPFGLNEDDVSEEEAFEMFRRVVLGVSKEALKSLKAAFKMFDGRVNNLKGRLADLLDAVMPLPNPVAIQPGEDGGTWFAFKDKASELWGYKDKNGTARIKPRFSEATAKFDHIAVIGEKNGNRYDRYYLTKTGKVATRGIYRDDECENEGFIRFKDKKNEMVGMFDKLGNVVIPADYDDLSKAQNGLVAAFRYYSVEKSGDNNDCDGGDDDCGGDDDMTRVKVVILDTLNNALLEVDTLAGRIKFNCLNRYSAVKTETPHPDTATRVSFPAKGGGFYSFICYEKEFRHWLKNDLLADLTPEKLAEAALDSVWCFMRPRDDEDYASANWKSERREFAGKVYDILKKDLMALLNPEREHTISREEINQFTFTREDPRYEKFYDNCGNKLEMMYPVFGIRLTPDNFEDPFGRYNDYDFLRTDDGYKLSCVQIRNNDLFLSARKGVSAGYFVTLGNLRLQNGDYDDALALYGEALARDSNCVPAQCNRGAVYYGMGEFAKSVAESERAMRLDSSEIGAHINRAISHAAMGEYKKAAEGYEKAANLKGDEALVFHNYSILYACMGDDSKADSLHKIAVRLNRKGVRGYYREDIADYGRFIKSQPRNTLMHYHRGVIYARMGEYAAAAEDLKTALKLNPKHALAKWWLGNIDKNLKNTKNGP